MKPQRNVLFSIVTAVMLVLPLMIFSFSVQPPRADAQTTESTVQLHNIKSVPWGKDVIVTGKLTDNDASGAGVAGKTITFDGTGADNLPDVITNADGMFTAQGPSPNTVATGWKVQAHFAGDSSLGASDSVVKPYNTLKHTVTLAVTTKASIPWGKPTSFTATLKDASLGGVPISGKTITFDGTGVIAENPAVITDSTGKATGTGNSPNSVASGWTYQAHFAGDSLYTNRDSAAKTYSTTKHAVTLGVITASVAWGQPNTFTATLKDASLGGVPIEGKTIHFDGTGVIGVADKTTDSAGKAVGTGTSPDSVATGWTYQAHFAGDSLYTNRDSAAKTYSTTKHGTTLIISISPSTVASDSTYKVSGVLKDSTAGAVLSSKTITITADSPITISDETTDTAGKYSADALQAPDDAGTYNIQSHYVGDSLYKAKDSPIKTLTVTAAEAEAAAADTEASTTMPESSSDSSE